VGTRTKTTVNVALICLPLLFFFIFNALTPYWCDDFPSMCYTTAWHEPRTRLNNSFQDIAQSTYNLYINAEQSGNARIFSTFLQFIFCSLKNKLTFNICNTIIYALCVFLICWHGFGSIKKITPLACFIINVLLWFLCPTFGQFFLWIGGSVYYLWPLVATLAFLVPYRKRAEYSAYIPNLACSILLLPCGFIVGVSAPNVAGTVFLVVVYYFARKILKKEHPAFFEFSGFAGLAAGLFVTLWALLRGVNGFGSVAWNIFLLLLQWTHFCALLSVLVIILCVKYFYYEKRPLRESVIVYSAIAVVCSGALVVAYIRERNLAFSVVFLIIALLNFRDYLPELSKKQKVLAALLITLIAVPSFFSGCFDIFKSFLLNESREQYIYAQKEAGVKDVVVKTPVDAIDPHTGIFVELDILTKDVEKVDKNQYLVQNGAKALYYGLNSLTGIPAEYQESDGGFAERITALWKNRKGKLPRWRDFSLILYDYWGFFKYYRHF
jgi:hypothetical protein